VDVRNSLTCYLKYSRARYAAASPLPTRRTVIGSGVGDGDALGGLPIAGGRPVSPDVPPVSVPSVLPRPVPETVPVVGVTVVPTPPLAGVVATELPTDDPPVEGALVRGADPRGVVDAGADRCFGVGSDVSGRDAPTAVSADCGALARPGPVAPPHTPPPCMPPVENPCEAVPPLDGCGACPK
jgi:hypothetical protein